MIDITLKSTCLIFIKSPMCLPLTPLQFKYAKISSSVNGKVKKGVIFSTYSALIGESSASGKYRTRFKQLLHWLGKDFDGLVSFLFEFDFAIQISVFLWASSFLSDMENMY